MTKHSCSLPLHQTVVEAVLSKIPASERQHISKELLDSAKAKFRLLSVKAAQPGQLGKGDSQESRAALILEQVVRMDGRRQKLSLQMLTKVVGVNRKNLEALQLKVDNYLTETILSGRVNGHVISSKRNISTISVGKTVSISSNSSIHSLSSRSLRSEQQAKPSSIPLLSIKLGSLMEDSHGFCQRAEELFSDIQAHIQTSQTINEHHRRDYKADLSKHQTAYEAVCFFLIATSLGISSKSDHSLTVHDVLDASGVSSLLWRQIIPTVDAFRVAIQSEKKQVVKTSQKRGRGDRLIDAAQTSILSAGGNADERAKQAVRNATAKRLLNVVITTGDSDGFSFGPSIPYAWPRALNLPPLPSHYVTKREGAVCRAIQAQQSKARLEHGEDISESEAKRRALHAIIRTVAFYNEDGTRKMESLGGAPL
jgi:hypothetical protein